MQWLSVASRKKKFALWISNANSMEQLFIEILYLLTRSNTYCVWASYLAGWKTLFYSKSTDLGLIHFRRYRRRFFCSSFFCRVPLYFEIFAKKNHEFSQYSNEAINILEKLCGNPFPNWLKYSNKCSMDRNIRDIIWRPIWGRVCYSFT